MTVELKYKDGTTRTINSSRGLKWNGMRPVKFKITLDEIDTINMNQVLLDIDRIRNSIVLR